ncbi:hypothetical protein [Lichenibacterium dinghuense]|uniref:hypothetical protein n=1 Tax=Lichenibacterium dinghuense TaxID=2895977 RepID=UPI001F3766D3|nr:hypothetical protein [Lichenibacterium sp. 6Y81]
MRQALLLAACLATLPGAASAQAPDRPDIVRGLCSKDGCDEFQIVGKTPIATGADGQLFRTQVRTFHASSGGRAAGGDEAGYVFCSATRPAILSAPAGRPPVAVYLAPDDRSPDWVLRGSANFTALYFALCHGVDAGRAALRDRAGEARALGYHVALETPRTVTLGRVEDVLKPQ